jgi:MYXO-CTERM domain-containing protein
MRLHGSLLRRRLASLLSVTGGLALAGHALASPSYPEALDKAAAMPCIPPCTVCHADMNGGFGTATKPFAQAMQAHGLTAADPSLIRPAVVGLFQDGVDSDGDGLTDVSELDNGTDPNLPGDVSICGPEYGCAVVDGGDAPDTGAPLLVLLGVVAFSLRRRKLRG